MLSLLLDEDSMHRGIARALHATGIDVISVSDAGRIGLADDEQLAFAATQGRAIYTRNVGDFTRLHREWLRAGLHHAGIIVLADQLTPIGVQVRALARLAQAFGPDSMRDRLEFLSNWHE